jgi:hypothetical protein
MIIGLVIFAVNYDDNPIFQNSGRIGFTKKKVADLNREESLYSIDNEVTRINLTFIFNGGDFFCF